MRVSEMITALGLRHKSSPNFVKKLALRIVDLITCVGWVESAKPNISGALGFVPQPNLQKSMLFNSHSLGFPLFQGSQCLSETVHCVRNARLCSFKERAG